MTVQENGLKFASGRLYLVLFDLLYSSMGSNVDNNVLTAHRRKLIETISTFEAKSDKKGATSYMDQMAAEMDGYGDVYDRTKY